MPKKHTEHAWHRPDADTLGRAMVLAEDRAASMQIAAVVCVSVYEGTIGYHVLTNEVYAGLRERSQSDHLAPICSVLPSGAVDIYPNIRGIDTLAERRHP